MQLLNQLQELKVTQNALESQLKEQTIKAQKASEACTKAESVGYSRRRLCSLRIQIACLRKPMAWKMNCAIKLGRSMSA